MRSVWMALLGILPAGIVAGCHGAFDRLSIRGCCPHWKPPSAARLPRVLAKPLGSLPGLGLLAEAACFRLHTAFRSLL